MNTINSLANRPMQLLVINNFFPDMGTDAGRRLMHILQALRELGHASTLIVRDGKNQEVLASAVHALEIKIYAGDAERLPALGKDPGHPSWSFSGVLAGEKFDAAILLQNLRCGISVPEHYIDAIRRSSPQTPILIWNDALYGKSA